MTTMRQTVFATLDAVAIGDVPRVRRLSRETMRLGPPSQRDRAARLWIASRGCAHPAVVAWIEKEIAEREAEERARRAPIYTTPNRFRPR